MTEVAGGASVPAAWRRPVRGSVRIVALGQAGFALLAGGDVVLIDPFLSARPDRVADAPVDGRSLRGVRAVLATHEHADHLDLPAWAAIATASPGARFVLPEPLVGRVREAGIPAHRVSGARPGRRQRIAGVSLTPVPARHAVRMDDGYSLGGHPAQAPRFVGYVADLDGVRIYHAGDTLFDESISRAVAALQPSIALLPINGRDPDREARGIVGNLTPEEAARLAREVGVELAIPMHFDTIGGNLGDPDKFVAAMRRLHPDGAVWVPRIGAELVWPAPPGARLGSVS